MIALVLAVLLASVLGSLHCAGMCGAFLALAVADSTDAPTSAWVQQGAYHAGRLITYVALGATAGLVGQNIDLQSSVMGLSNIAAILAAATIALFGVVILVRHCGYRVPRAGIPQFWVSAIEAAQRAALSLEPLRRALVIGLTTTLLPCGFLWVFVITAAGTAHPLRAIVVMIVFWMGTLPIMVTFGAGIRGLSGRFGRHAPVLTGLSLVIIGLGMVFFRGWMPVPCHASSDAEILHVLLPGYSDTATLDHQTCSGSVK